MNKNNVCVVDGKLDIPVNPDGEAEDADWQRTELLKSSNPCPARRYMLYQWLGKPPAVYDLVTSDAVNNTEVASNAIDGTVITLWHNINK